MKLEKVRMKTMFKKTLLAASVVAFAGTAGAATLVGTEHTATAEYLAGTTNPTTATDNTFHKAALVTMTLGAEYTLNDTITLTSTAEFGVDMPVNLIAAKVNNVAPAADLQGMTFSKISGGAVGDKTVTYRLTSVDVAGLDPNPLTTGVQFTIPAANLEFKKAKLSAGASLTFSAKTNTNLDLDTAGGTARTASLVKIAAQFTKTAPSFAKVIDVNANRKQFVGANTAARKVTGTFNVVTLATAGNTFARDITKVVHTVSGDFSWVKDTNANTAGLQPAANVFTTTGTCANAAWTYSTSAVTLQCDAVAADTAIVIDADVNAAAYTAGSEPVLPAQDLKVTSEVTYSNATATAKVFDNEAGGSWTLNGANIQVPYMVFGTVGGKAYNQVIVLNNASSVSGDVYVDVYKEDGTSVLSNKKVATAAANSAANIAGAIKTELVAAGAADGKFSVKVVANIPETKATVYSAFVDTITGERIIVNNDSKVQTK